VLAVNKMDLVGYAEATFEAIVADYRAFAARLGVGTIDALPVSGLRGDNIVAGSEHMPWYLGPSLLGLLESVSLRGAAEQQRPFRMPVQWINRPHLNFRGVAGEISAGVVRVGDTVRIVPSGRLVQVGRIVTMDGDLPEAVAGQSVTLCFTDEVDCSRGDVLAAPAAAPEAADQFEATLVWMAQDDLVPGRRYWLKLATQTVAATLAAPKYQVNVNTLEHLAAKTLPLNGIGVCTLSTDRPLVFAPYTEDRTLGGFILIDRESNATVAAGMLNFSLRRAQNIHHQSLTVAREARARLKNQQPAVLWFTGLSGAGKSTIANLVDKRLHRMNRHTFLLDGDNVRHGLNKDLGFTETDRIENIRRAGEVAKLMTDAGLIVITAFISPFRAERQLVRDMISSGEFYEVFIDTPLAVAESRDVKGLYKKARAGQLRNFTGIDSPYEPPATPEIHIDTGRTTPDEAADLIVARLVPWT
jgi:bifunctional enzyme CysN/CysC